MTTFKPHPYQEQGIEWLITRPAAGLFWPPGLGKTAVVLASYHILRKNCMVRRMLIVAKRRICYRVWPLELGKWKFPYSSSVLHGAGKQEAALDSSDIHIVNYEGLDWLVPLIKKHKPYDMLVIDESSQIRNHRTRRFKNLRKIMNLFRRRYILTGTPAPRGLLGLWSQMFVLDAGLALSHSVVAYRNRYFYPTGYKGKEYAPVEDAEEGIQKRISPLVLHTSNKVLKLPERVVVQRSVTLPVKARLAYEEFRIEMHLEIEEGRVTATNAGVATQKLRQLASGSVYFYDNNNVRKTKVFHQEKALELLDLVEELQGTPCLVAYEFKHDVPAICDVFGYTVPHIGGDTTDEEANRLEQEWNAGRIPVLLGQPDSIAHGLNLQDAGNVVVYYGLTWNFENYEQFYQRVLRQGQVASEVIVYHIVADDTVDEVILRTLDRRENLQERLFSALAEHVGANMAVRKRQKPKTPSLPPEAPPPPPEPPKSVTIKVKPEAFLKAMAELASKDLDKPFPYEKGDKYAVVNFWLRWLQTIGAASVKDHQDFQKKVLKADDVVKGDWLTTAYRVTRLATLTALKIKEDITTDTVEIEDVSVLNSWPNIKEVFIQSGDDMNAAVAKKKSVKRAPKNVTAGDEAATATPAKRRARKRKSAESAEKPAKTASKGVGRGRPSQGLLAPLSAKPDWAKLPLSTVVRANPKADAEELKKRPKIALVHETLGRKKMTVQDLIDADMPKVGVWNGVNRGHLLVVD